LSTASFASLPLPRGPASPGQSLNFKEHAKIMRPELIPSQWIQHVEKLRGKWINFTNAIVRTIANELLHIRREEMKEQLCAHNQGEQSREAAQQ
jgi:hypothetical protein